MESRYFQVRKKVDGNFSLIKRFNTNDEISYLPFFGYEVNTWYTVSIELKFDSIDIYVSLLGVTAKMIVFKLKDNSFKFGYVGFGTYGTEAAFSEIFIRPFPIPYGMLFINII